MNIQEAENKLFEKWQEKRPNRTPFVKDGAVNGDKYEKSKVKTAFVLKEYAHAEEGHDLRKEELTRYQWRIWTTVAKTLYGIRRMSGDEQQGFGWNMPGSVCAFNLDKSGGPAITNMVQLALIAMRDRKFIKQQVEIYQPHLLICGGTFDIFRYVDGYGDEAPNQTPTQKVRWYKSGNKRYVIDAYHPSYPGWGDEYTGKLLDAIREMDNNALDLSE